jgi:hypothetical protein
MRVGPVIVTSGEARSRTVEAGALFYAMSCAFIGLFAFVLWYCPRHL